MKNKFELYSDIDTKFDNDTKLAVIITNRKIFNKLVCEKSNLQKDYNLFIQRQ